MPQPASHSLAQYIQAAASGNRDALLHLVVAIFTSAKSALACLCQHFKTHPRALTLENLARIKYCATRLQAIFHTLTHAPERFFTPAQLRALTRAQAILAHLWRQPVDFTPLVPLLTSPEACPPPPRAAAPLGARTPSSAPDHRPPASTSLIQDAPQTPAPSGSAAADPLLLRSPGCALASVLLHVAALYGIATHPAPKPRPASTIPTASPALSDPSVISTSSSTPATDRHAVSSISPHATLRVPHLPFRPPP